MRQPVGSGTLSRMLLLRREGSRKRSPDFTYAEDIFSASASDVEAFFVFRLSHLHAPVSLAGS